MMSDQVGKIIGWIAIVLSVIGFIIWHVPLGIAAMILGAIGLASPQKGINWTAVAFGAIAVIVGII